VLALLSPLIVVASVALVPLVDLVMAVVRRTRAGRSPFAPDKMHLHHRLLEIGHSQRRAVLLIYLWAGVLAFGAVRWRWWTTRSSCCGAPGWASCWRCSRRRCPGRAPREGGRRAEDRRAGAAGGAGADPARAGRVDAAPHPGRGRDDGRRDGRRGTVAAGVPER
jgi:hypothetical protein